MTDIPGLLAGFTPRRSIRLAYDAARPTRFITQSHALSRSRLRPGALLLAATIAAALVWIGCRLSD